MQRLYATFIALITAISLSAQGWPSNYDGVMLQGFYWDSYDDSKWTVLENQADELSQYFDLIWIPNSGKTSDYHHTQRKTMGYDPCFWLDHNTCFGTETELKKMIQTFKAKGTGIIEDVVINHKNGLNTWVDFPNEEVGEYKITWDNENYTAICITDECNSNDNIGKWSTNKKKTGGAADTGDDFSGYRDLDHKNAIVQQNVKTYLQYLTKELGYVGFRYDMVKGFTGDYVGMYNASVNPSYDNPPFSVGEYWDYDVQKVVNWIVKTKTDDKIQSAAFDFPMKQKINAAFGGRQWSKLKDDLLTTREGYSRYSVTFVDNHDTYRENVRLHYNICAANAYILTMPGTPCLFLPHWQAYKGTLKKLISLRKAAGINNQSKILSATATDKSFTLNVEGTKGKLILIAGVNENSSAIDGYKLALSGNRFWVYVNNDLDISSLQSITDIDSQQETTSLPDFCKVEDGETCAFFEVPAWWGMNNSQTVRCWRWDKQYNYTTGNWPGSTCKKVGTASNNNAVWKWTYKTGERKDASGNTNEGIIFSNGLTGDNAKQTDDLPFENGGYYTTNGAWDNVINPTTGISFVTTEKLMQTDNNIYSLDGRLVRTDGKLENLPKGIYILNKKKVILK